MKDPVMVATGHTYDRPSIKRWLEQGHKTCPVTGSRLRNLDLLPNFALRSAISEWAAANNVKLNDRQLTSVTEKAVGAPTASPTRRPALTACSRVTRRSYGRWRRRMGTCLAPPRTSRSALGTPRRAGACTCWRSTHQASALAGGESTARQALLWILRLQHMRVGPRHIQAHKVPARTHGRRTFVGGGWGHASSVPRTIQPYGRTTSTR